MKAERAELLNVARNVQWLLFEYNASPQATASFACSASKRHRDLVPNPPHNTDIKHSNSSDHLLYKQDTMKPVSLSESKQMVYHVGAACRTI